MDYAMTSVKIGEFRLFMTSAKWTKLLFEAKPDITEECSDRRHCLLKMSVAQKASSIIIVALGGLQQTLTVS